LLYFAVLFQELVEQHRVHRIVAHGIKLFRQRRARPDRDSPFPPPRPLGQITGLRKRHGQAGFQLR
jgi:hypothetical protein